MKCIALLFFVPSLAMASFSGQFNGSGQAVMHPSEKKRICSEIFMQIKQDEKSLQVLVGGYVCADLQADFPRFSLDIKNGDLLSDNVKVGTITADEINLYQINQDENFTYHLHLVRKSQQMMFDEEWTDSTSPALSVTGTMTGH